MSSSSELQDTRGWLGTGVTGFVGWLQMHVQVVVLHYVRLVADVAAV